MAKRNFGKTAFSFGLGIGLGVISATGGRAIGDHNPDQTKVGDYARLEASSPAASSDCEVKLDAYNEAIQDREDAEEAEVIAYYAWASCERKGGSVPTTTAPVLSSEHSVLVDN